MAKALTEARIRSARPQEKVSKLVDGRGLALLVTPAGVHRGEYGAAIEHRALKRAAVEQLAHTVERLRQAESNAQEVVARHADAAKAAIAEHASHVQTWAEAGSVGDAPALIVDERAVRSRQAAESQLAAITQARQAAESQLNAAQAELQKAESVVVAAVDRILSAGAEGIAAEILGHIEEAKRLGERCAEFLALLQVGKQKAPRAGPSSARKCSAQDDCQAAIARSCQFFGRMTASMA